MPLRRVEAMPETVNVRIVRSRGYVSGGRRFKVYLDGQLVCKLRNGQEKELVVAAGKHRVSARIDWSRTRELELDCDGEETVVIRVYCPLVGWKILLVPFVLFIPRAWIGIEVGNK